MRTVPAILADMEKGEVLPLYVLFGVETYLGELLIDRLKERLVAPDWAEMNFLRFDGDDPEAYRLARTPLFGGNRRLIVLENSSVLGGTRRGQETRVEGARQALESYLQRSAADCCLVVVSAVDKADKRLKLVKLLLERGMLVECRPLTHGDAVGWSVKFVQQAHKQLDQQAASYIVESSSRRLHDIRNELEKLILFVGDKPRVELTDARQAGSARVAEIFDLTDAVMAGASGEAMAALQSLLEQGQPPAVVLFMLARQFRLLWAAKREGYRSKALAGLPRFVVERMVRSAEKTAWSSLEAAFATLLELDSHIKLGRGDATRALELAVLRLSAGARER